MAQATEALSGTPVWSVSEDMIVALVVASRSPSGGPALHTIPADTIRDTFAEQGLGQWLARGHDDVASLLIGVLSRLFGDPRHRREAGLAVAQALGLDPPQDDSAPPLDELADLLLTHKRALPTLVDILTSRGGAYSPEAAEQLLSVGRLIPYPLLLSVAEFDHLLAMLTPLVQADPGLLRRAGRDALPYALGPRFPDDEAMDVNVLRDAVMYWEQLSGDGLRPDGPGARVPALLRVVEYVAATVEKAPRKELRRWSAGVAARLGLPGVALAERRADAEQWAGHSRAGEEAATGLSRRLHVYMSAAGSRVRTRDIGARITTQSALEQLRYSPTVREVTCTGAFRNLSTLAALPALLTLTIDANPLLEDLADLRGCAKLRTLTLTGCDALRDLSSLDETGVMFLELAQPEIRVAVLRTLGTARWLRVLRLSGPPQDGTLEGLLPALPGVGVEVWE